MNICRFLTLGKDLEFFLTRFLQVFFLPPDFLFLHVCFHLNRICAGHEMTTNISSDFLMKEWNWTYQGKGQRSLSNYSPVTQINKIVCLPKTKKSWRYQHFSVHLTDDHYRDICKTKNSWSQFYYFLFGEDLCFIYSH